jgi:hypothetical protein
MPGAREAAGRRLCFPVTRTIAGKCVMLKHTREKGDRHHLCAAPSGPFRQMVSAPFSPTVGSVIETLDG